MLAANIYRDGQRMFEPYRIFERGGYRIAVLGLTTDDTNKMVLPDNLRGIEVRRPIPEAALLVPQLRAQADMVIATTHMGHYPDGKRGVNAPGDVEMARAVSGLDLVVGGHSQNPVCMLAENRRNEAYVPGTPCAPDRQNGSWIVQAHEWGKYVGRADFVIDAGKVELVKYQLLPVNLKQRLADGSKQLYAAPIAESPAMLAMLQPFELAGQGRLVVPVGSADGVLDGDRVRVRRQPTNLGTLIARAMMDRTGADLALINAGGVRDSLPAGQITYRDVLKVQPFANTVGVVTFSGTELLAYLRAAAKMTPASGGFAHLAGARMRIVDGELQAVLVAGQAVDPAKRYRLALNTFTAVGGDAYPPINTHPAYVDTGYNDADVLRAYISAHSPLKVADFDPGDDVTRR
jgi:5'-nucleotidase/UDP-sugar diphosphatase